MYLKSFSICIFVLILVGCTKIEDMKKMDRFEVTTRAYTHSIRWSEFEDAALFLKAEEEEEESNSPDPEFMKLIRVTDYTIKKTAVSEDQTKVFQIVDISYYRNDRMVVKTIREKELWEWSEEKSEWELSSGLPKFK